MAISTPARVIGFVCALGASAALVVTAVDTTGAYFTDSHPGTIAASTGHLTINTTSTALNFTDLMPGDYQTQTINYNTNSNGNEDVWLYFPAGAAYSQFTGNKNSVTYPGGGLGRYGHFAVAVADGTTVFSSYNLQDIDTADTLTGCADNVNGSGSSPAATSRNDTPPLCGVPHYIKIASNLPSGTDGHLTLTFGVTGRQIGQNATVMPTVPFSVVGVQTGISPTAADPLANPNPNF